MAPKLSSSSANNKNEDGIPREFICPITHEIMRDPLMCRNGQVFERDAIMDWLANHQNTCPITRQTLNAPDMIRHRALKAQIESWCKINNHDLEERTSKMHVLTCLSSDVQPKSEEEANKRERNTRKFFKKILKIANK